MMCIDSVTSAYILPLLLELLLITVFILYKTFILTNNHTIYITISFIQHVIRVDQFLVCVFDTMYDE